MLFFNFSLTSGAIFGYKGSRSKKSAGKKPDETDDATEEILQQPALHGGHHHRRDGDVPGGRAQSLRPESPPNPLSLSRAPDSFGFPLVGTRARPGGGAPPFPRCVPSGAPGSRGESASLRSRSTPARCRFRLTQFLPRSIGHRHPGGHSREIPAFEGRCIRPGVVALPRRTAAGAPR
jgi:hypothetical protein